MHEKGDDAGRVVDRDTRAAMKRHRPPAAGGPRVHHLHVRVSDTELERFTIAAEREALPLATWVRRCLIKSARAAR